MSGASRLHPRLRLDCGERALSRRGGRGAGWATPPSRALAKHVARSRRVSTGHEGDGPGALALSSRPARAAGFMAGPRARASVLLRLPGAVLGRGVPRHCPRVTGATPPQRQREGGAARNAKPSAAPLQTERCGLGETHSAPRRRPGGLPEQAPDRGCAASPAGPGGRVLPPAWDKHHAPQARAPRAAPPRTPGARGPPHAQRSVPREQSGCFPGKQRVMAIFFLGVNTRKWGLSQSLAPPPAPGCRREGGPHGGPRSSSGHRPHRVRAAAWSLAGAAPGGPVQGARRLPAGGAAPGPGGPRPAEGRAAQRHLLPPPLLGRSGHALPSCSHSHSTPVDTPSVLKFLLSEPVKLVA